MTLRGGGLSSVDADSVAVIDAGSGTIESAVGVGRRPVGIAADQDSVWVANSIDRTVTHVRGDENGGVLTSPVGPGPASIAVGDGIVWVANTDSNNVSRVDAATGRELPGSPVQAGNGLSGIAYGSAAAWITNAVDGTVWRLDARTGRKTKEVRVGAGLRDLAVTREGVWVTSETAGTVTQVSPTTGAVVAVVNVGNGARAVAVGAGAVWVANAFDGTISRIDPNDRRLKGTIRVGREPRAIAVAAGRVFVANEGDGTVSVVDPQRRRVIQTIDLGNAPMDLATDGDRVWVLMRGGIARYRGGTLRVGTFIEPYTLDPTFGWNTFNFAITQATHDGLLGYKKVGGVEGSVLLPDLAEELIPPTDDGKTYSFTLRRGLRYSDGTPVRASDVRKSFERIFLSEGPAGGFFGVIKGGEKCSPEGCDLSQGIVTDDATRSVIFHLERALPDFPYYLAHPISVIVPPGTPAEDVGFKAIPGTGPYRLSKVELSEGVGRLELERNPHFRSRGPVQPDGYPNQIVFSLGGPPEEHVAAVKAGREDWLLSEPFDPGFDPERLATEIPAQFHVFDVQSVSYAGLNPNVPPLDDVRVRKAINFALDRDALIARSGGRFGATVTCQVLPKNVFGYEPYCPYTKDPDPSGGWSGPDLATARRLVAESGTRGARISVWSSAEGPQREAAEVLAATLRSLGYRPSLRSFTFPDDFEAFHQRAEDAKGFPVLIGGWFADYASPANFFLPQLACRNFFNTLAGRPDASANFSHFCAPSIDEMMVRALTQQAIDPLRSARDWAAIDKAFVDAAPWAPYATIRGSVIVSARVGNVQSNPLLQLLTTQMWLSDRK